MEISPGEEIERLMFLEGIKARALADYARNPKDADVLATLGRTYVELAQYYQGQESAQMISDAVSKLEESVKINSNKPDTLWWLGNALTTQGFHTPEATKANVLFEKAAVRFRQAIEMDPGNDAYRKSLEVSLQGPELHQQIQQQMQAMAGISQQGGPPSEGAPSSKGGKKKKSNDLYYDVAGWVILTAAVFTWLSVISLKAGAAAAAAGPSQ
eukprot:TRINITY_DN307_c1_g1_i2.p1 TRINITY_DN307_c1_g1~~TRINITY_DN307_c1_g1_i2.p1  ORF type:complete len:244 (-),score=86.38 TRINITY_DN307_c1_g1_i2:326-964(-)